jgi:hypothetical protein
MSQLPPGVAERFQQSQGLPPDVLERYKQTQAQTAPPREQPGAVANMLGESGAWLLRNIKKASDAYSGDTTREFDYPELQQNIITGGKTIPIQDRLALAHGNPLKMAQAAQRLLPDARVDFDKFQNPYIELPVGNGKFERRYLNRPGMSPADVSNMAVNAVNETVGAVVGGKTGRAVGGFAGQALGTGLGLAGASATEDVAGGHSIDPQRAALLGLLGVVGEIAAPVLARFVDKFMASADMVRNGVVTERGAEILEQAGIDPATVSQEFVNRWAQTANRSVNPGEDAVLAQAESLPVPVPLSRGDITRDVGHQRFESEAQKGVRGEQAQGTMTAFRDRQNQSLGANVDAMQAQVGGRQPGTPGVGPTAGMDRAQSRIGRMRDEAKAEVDAAYNAAREGSTSILTEGAKGLAMHMRRAFAGQWNPRTAPKVAGMLQDLATQTSQEGVKAVKVRALEEWRAQMAGLARSMDPVEKGAAKAALREYDNYMTNFLDEAMVRGHDEAIEAFRNARGLRARMASNFEENELLAKIIERDPSRNERGTLLREPEEALNLLFTASKLGAKNGAPRALRQMRRLLGPNSEEWRELKEEAFMRLFRNQNANDMNEAMVAKFSGDRFATAINTVMRDNPALMRVLFDRREIQLLRQFRDVAQRATNKVDGAVNHSNSAISMQSILGQLFGPTARVIEVTMQRMFRAIEPEVQRGTARRAINYRPGRRQTLPAGAGGAAAAQLYEE